MTDAEFGKLVDAFGQKAHDVGAGHAVEGLGESRRKVLDAHAEVVRWYQDEYAIVDRVWKALGITTYEGAGGKSLDELVRGLQSELASTIADRDFWKLQRTPLTEAELERGYAIAKKHGVDVERIRELERERDAARKECEELKGYLQEYRTQGNS